MTYFLSRFKGDLEKKEETVKIEGKEILDGWQFVVRSLKIKEICDKYSLGVLQTASMDCRLSETARMDWRYRSFLSEFVTTHPVFFYHE